MELARAVEAAPGNVYYRHWLNVYRWRSMCRNIDPNTDDIVLLAENVESVRSPVGTVTDGNSPVRQ